MNHSLKIIFAVALLAIFLSKPALAAVQPGDFAPNLTAKDFDGQSFDLAALKGKIVVLDFWATWCPPCREELPELGAFNARHHGTDVAVLAISVDSHKNKAQVVDVARAFRIPAVMYGDIKDGGWGLPPLIPTTFIIDTNGMVQARLTPEIQLVTDNVLENYVKQLTPSPVSKEKEKEKAKADEAPKNGNVTVGAAPK